MLSQAGPEEFETSSLLSACVYMHRNNVAVHAHIHIYIHRHTQHLHLKCMYI